MAVLEKVKLLCVIAALLSLGPVSAVKTGSKQQGDSIDLMRREHSQMTVDNNSSDLIEAVTSEKAQVALSATGSMSGVFHHEAHHAVTQATGFALNLNSSLQASCQTSETGLMYAAADSTQWGGKDMVGQTRTVEQNGDSCRLRCAGVVGCAYFTFWADGGCHLQDSSAILRSSPGSTLETTFGDPHCHVQASSTGLVVSFRASTSSSSSLEDPVSGMTLTPKAVTKYAGHDCWNLDNDYLEYAGGSSKPLHGQKYTLAAWVFWRLSDHEWRTIHRGSSDHGILVQHGTKNLGMYSNRGGAFRDSGYDITDDMSTWQLVIVTGSGDTATSSTGTSTFFTAAEGDSAVQQRGTASYVVSGTHFYRVGWPGQGPGKVAAVYEFNRILTETEMNQLLTKGVGADAQAVPPLRVRGTNGKVTWTMKYDSLHFRFVNDNPGNPYYLQFVTTSQAAGFLDGSFTQPIRMAQGSVGGWHNDGGLTLNRDGRITRPDLVTPFHANEATWEWATKEYSLTFGNQASYCVTSDGGNAEPTYYQLAMGLSLAECASQVKSAGYPYMNFWSNDGRCRGLNKCPYEYDCTSRYCSSYNNYVKTYTITQAPQTTTTTTLAHKAMFGTVHCMQKLSCYNKLKHKGVMFTCYCIFNMAVADADQIDCAEWLACMKQDDSNAFVASAVEVFYHLRNPYTIGDSSQLLQHSNSERSTVPKDDADCWHPDIHNEADLKCDCWDDMKASCSGNEGDALYECLRILLCGSPNVCHDWKQPVDPTLTGQCIPSEISGATPSLAVQGIQKGEQRVLADMFQGRRQPPQNASLFASSVELEHSVSGKACARSAR